MESKKIAFKKLCIFLKSFTVIYSFKKLDQNSWNLRNSHFEKFSYQKTLQIKIKIFQYATIKVRVKK